MSEDMRTRTHVNLGNFLIVSLTGRERGQEGSPTHTSLSLNFRFCPAGDAVDAVRNRGAGPAQRGPQPVAAPGETALRDSPPPACRPAP